MSSHGGLLAFELQPWCSTLLGLDTSQGMLQVMEDAAGDGVALCGDGDEQQKSLADWW